MLTRFSKIDDDDDDDDDGDDGITTKKSTKPTVLVLFGPPGSGKGTQSRSLASRSPKWIHIDFGQCIRNAVNNRTDIGQKVLKSGLFKAGKILPPEIVFQIVDDAFRRHQCDGVNHFIIDGICRTLKSTKHLLDIANIVLCVDLQISEKDIIERVCGRRIHKPSGRTYHIKHNPPRVLGLDDVTGEKLHRRSNDTPEGIRSRMIVHRDESLPILDFFRDVSYTPVLSLDATLPIHKITQRIEAAYTDITGGLSF